MSCTSAALCVQLHVVSLVQGCADLRVLIRHSFMRLRPTRDRNTFAFGALLPCLCGIQHNVPCYWFGLIVGSVHCGFHVGTLAFQASVALMQSFAGREMNTINAFRVIAFYCCLCGSVGGGSLRGQ